VFVPGQCQSTDYNCRRIESAARTAGAIGGTAAVLSGLKKYSDAKIHTQALKEMSETFQSEVKQQNVDVEGRTLRLTGTADEQYREWRQLLQQLYVEEAGGTTTTLNTTAPTSPDAAGSAVPVDAVPTAPVSPEQPASKKPAPQKTAPMKVAVEQPSSTTPVRP
jgi:hypothetical protein